MKKFTLMLFMCLVSLCSYAQFPEYFEGTWTTGSGPAGWAIVNAAGPVQTWIQGNGGSTQPAYQGSHSAFLNAENVADNTTTEDWLITPSFVVPTNAQLHFFSKLFLGGDQGSQYKIMVSSVVGTTGQQTTTSNFTAIQTWTELTLNPSQTDWTEKIVNIPSTYPAGSTIYLAFVMMTDNGDRWDIDNVNVASECLAPTTLAASNIGTTTASLSWTNPGIATAWEIEVLPQAGTPTGVGVPYSGTLPFQAGTTGSGVTLLEDTCYKYYVRSACSTDNNSTWVGPYNFCTTGPGESCAAPIVIAGLPYSTTDDTANYGDNISIEGTPGATGCGVTNAYLGGNDVVYAYTPTTTGIIDITMSPTATYSGIFVYDSCANIGVSCIGGAGNSGTTVRTISNLSVTAGTTYYIVISTWPAPQTTGYTLTIQQVNCLPPVGQATTGVTATTATLNWSNPGNATSWQYVVQAPGAGIPTGAGTTASSNVLPLTTLTTATSYEYYVRADCGNGTFSAWAGPYSFMTTQVPATMNYTQDFEGITGWSLSNGSQTNKWAVGTATSNGGTHSLYVSNDNGVSNAYNTSASSVVHAYRDIQMPALVDQVNLAFDWKNVGETGWDYIRVWLVPASFVPTTGTQITAAADRIQIGGNYVGSSSWATVNSTIGAGAFSNSIARLIFEWRNDGGGGTQPPGAIDNVNLSVITCPSPSNIVVSNPTDNSGTFTWTAPTSVSPTYDYYFTTTNTAPTATTTPTGNLTSATFNATSLAPSTTYYLWVRSNCGTTDGTSIWVGPGIYTTPQVAGTLNYTQDFEAANTEWTLNNGTQTNQWVIGTATSNSPTHSLYITNDGGTTNAYNTGTTSVVQAYRDLLIPAGAVDINIGFDWKNIGENGFDYIRVWMVPITFTPTAGTQITAAADRVQVGGNLNSNGTWTTSNTIYNASAYANTVRRFVFEWRNDNSVGTQPPAAIDNVNISVITCPQPTALTATSTDTQATLGWTNQGTATAWEVYVVPTGQPAPTATTAGVAANTNPFTVTINPSTTYQFYVRAVCSDTDKSFWSGPFSFTTPIGNNECSGAYTLPVNPTDACADVTAVLFTGATASASTGTLCTGVTNGADVWFEFTATEQYHSVSLSDFTGTAQPIVLSIYDGSTCTALGDPIYCSFNNVINATGLTPGNVYTVRAVINAASPSLTTGFNICVNTPQLNGGPDPSQCQITTINADFELPDITGPYPPLVNDNTVPGWRTTATDHMIEIWPDPNYQGVPAYSGTQFIELNANQVSGVYQDYNSPPGTVFTYSFAHRARTLNTIVQTDVVQLFAGTPGGTYLPVGNPVSSTSSAWTFNTGTYTVPAGQPVTRFIFQSISSGNGDPTVGNFLDAISFSANNGILSANPAVLDCDNNVANVLAAGGGIWTAHTDNPGVTVIADPSSNTTTISGFTIPGTYYYDWTTEFCSSSLIINYQGGDIPLPVVADVTYCAGDTAVPLTATALAGNVLNWYDAATGGTELATAPTPVTATAGTTTYYVSQTQVNCESPRAAINVIVNPLPAAPTVTDVTYCQNAVATPLTATADAGNTLNWYTIANGGTALAGAPTPATTVTGTSVYYVSQQTATGCESDRAAIAVTINPAITPITGFTLPATVCAADTNPVPTPSVGFTTGGTYTAGTGLVIDPVTGIIDLAASTAGTYTVTYTVTADAVNCNVGGSAQAAITITPLITPVTAFSYTNVCSDAANQSPVLAAGFTTGGTFTADNAALAVDPVTGAINMAASATGTYTVTYTFNLDATTCTAAATNTATITITPVFVPVVEFNFEDSYCFGTASATPSLAANFTAGGTYTASAGLTIDAVTGAVNVAGSAPGVYNVTYTIPADAANCSHGGTFTDSFTIGGEIAFTLEGNCEENSFIITATPAEGSFDPAVVTYEWATESGTPVGVNSASFNVSDYAASAQGQLTFPISFVLTVVNNGCESSVLYEVQDISCTIQRGISPNNDGLNDNFQLTSLGVKKLSIFNRYGKEVYVKSNYSAEWYGQTNGGDELPTGTYFYVIERNTGDSKTGWIYINRQVN